MADIVPDLVADTLSANFDNFVNDNIGFLKQEPWSVVLAMSVSFFAGLFAPDLPDAVLEFLDQPLVRVIGMFVVAWSAASSPSLAIVIAVAYLMATNALAGRKLFEAFAAHAPSMSAQYLEDDGDMEHVVGGHMMVPQPAPQ